MANLALWSNDVETIVCESAYQAQQVSMFTSGCSAEEVPLEDWHREADDETLNIWWHYDPSGATEPGEPGAGKIKLTAAQWVIVAGPGFLCSTEY